MDKAKLDAFNKKAKSIEFEARDLLSQVSKDTMDTYTDSSLYDAPVERYNAISELAAKYKKFVESARDELGDVLDSNSLPNKVSFNSKNSPIYGNTVRRPDAKSALNEIIDEIEKVSRSTKNLVADQANFAAKPPSKSSKNNPRKTIPKHVRELVWKRYNGVSLNGKCYSCGYPITYDHFEVGHNESHANNGPDDIENLRPICGNCNRSMGSSMTIEEFKARYFKSGS